MVMAGATAGNRLLYFFCQLCTSVRVVRGSGCLVCPDTQRVRSFCAEEKCVVQELGAGRISVTFTQQSIFSEFLSLGCSCVRASDVCADEAYYVSNVMSAALQFCEAQEAYYDHINPAYNWCFLEALVRVYRSAPGCLSEIPRVSLTWWLGHHQRMRSVGAFVAVWVELNKQLGQASVLQ